MKNKMPEFKSEEEEEGRFWQTHSSLDYREEFTDVKELLEFDPVLLKKAAERRAQRENVTLL